MRLDDDRTVAEIVADKACDHFSKLASLAARAQGARELGVVAAHSRNFQPIEEFFMEKSAEWAKVKLGGYFLRPSLIGAGTGALTGGAIGGLTDTEGLTAGQRIGRAAAGAGAGALVGAGLGAGAGAGRRKLVGMADELLEPARKDALELSALLNNPKYSDEARQALTELATRRTGFHVTPGAVARELDHSDVRSAFNLGDAIRQHTREAEEFSQWARPTAKAISDPMVVGTAGAAGLGAGALGAGAVTPSNEKRLEQLEQKRKETMAKQGMVKLAAEDIEKLSNFDLLKFGSAAVDELGYEHMEKVAYAILDDELDWGGMEEMEKVALGWLSRAAGGLKKGLSAAKNFFTKGRTVKMPGAPSGGKAPGQPGMFRKAWDRVTKGKTMQAPGMTTQKGTMRTQAFGQKGRAQAAARRAPQEISAPDSPQVARYRQQAQQMRQGGAEGYRQGARPTTPPAPAGGARQPAPAIKAAPGAPGPATPPLRTPPGYTPPTPAAGAAPRAPAAPRPAAQPAAATPPPAAPQAAPGIQGAPGAGAGAAAPPAAAPRPPAPAAPSAGAPAGAPPTAAPTPQAPAIQGGSPPGTMRRQFEALNPNAARTVGEAPRIEGGRLVREGGSAAVGAGGGGGAAGAAEDVVDAATGQRKRWLTPWRKLQIAGTGLALGGTYLGGKALDAGQAFLTPQPPGTAYQYGGGAPSPFMHQQYA